MSDQIQRIPVVRVYADASRRPLWVGWGAVVLVEGRKPHIMGGGLRRNNGALRTKGKTDVLESLAAILARNAARRWLRRNGMRAELMVVNTDNQSVATKLMLEEDGRRLSYRWISREHPMMLLAHRRARYMNH